MAMEQSLPRNDSESVWSKCLASDRPLISIPDRWAEKRRNRKRKVQSRSSLEATPPVLVQALKVESKGYSPPSEESIDKRLQSSSDDEDNLDCLEAKRAKRRKSNRAAAQQSRLRKKKYLAELEAKVESLIKINEELQSNIKALQHENKILSEKNSKLNVLSSCNSDSSMKCDNLVLATSTSTEVVKSIPSVDHSQKVGSSISQSALPHSSSGSADDQTLQLPAGVNVGIGTVKSLESQEEGALRESAVFAPQQSEAPNSCSPVMFHSQKTIQLQLRKIFYWILLYLVLSQTSAGMIMNSSLWNPKSPLWISRILQRPSRYQTPYSYRVWKPLNLIFRCHNRRSAFILVLICQTALKAYKGPVI